MNTRQAIIKNSCVYTTKPAYVHNTHLSIDKNNPQTDIQIHTLVHTIKRQGTHWI